MKKNGLRWFLLITATLSLWLMLFSPVGCSKYHVPSIVPVGDVRLVGVVKDGVLRLEPGEDPKGSYDVVTKALTVKLYDVLMENQRLKLELEKARAQKDNP